MTATDDSSPANQTSPERQGDALDREREFLEERLSPLAPAASAETESPSEPEDDTGDAETDQAPPPPFDRASLIEEYRWHQRATAASPGRETSRRQDEDCLPDEKR